jgi:hypothetical protein
MKNTSKPQWLIDAEKDIQEFKDSKYGKMSPAQLARSINGTISGKKSEKINKIVAKEIRELYSTGDYSQNELAKLYGFKGSNTISEIIQNTTYIDNNYCPPKNSCELKKNAIIIKILNELPEIFTSADVANYIIKLNIKDSYKLAIKEARRILLENKYFIKIPTKNGGMGNQHDPQFYKKRTNFR